jgi:hypothetical protein
MPPDHRLNGGKPVLLISGRITLSNLPRSDLRQSTTSPLTPDQHRSKAMSMTVDCANIQIG